MGRLLLVLLVTKLSSVAVLSIVCGTKHEHPYNYYIARISVCSQVFIFYGKWYHDDTWFTQRDTEIRSSKV
jgi:hypothetical protein